MSQGRIGITEVQYEPCYRRHLRLTDLLEALGLIALAFPHILNTVPDRNKADS